MDLGYCKPIKEIKAYYPRPYHYNLGATIGLRRHNIVLELDDEEFINNFYRIER